MNWRDHLALLLGAASLSMIATPAFAQSEDEEWEGAYIGGSIGLAAQNNDRNENVVFDTNLDGGFGDTVNTSLVITSDGTAASTRCYLNGIDTGLSWSANPNAWAAGVKTIAIGGSAGGLQGALDGSFVVMGYNNIPWSPAHARAFHANPWQLSAPRRLYIPTSTAAATVPTLSAPTYVPGSLSSTGWRPRVTATY